MRGNSFANGPRPSWLRDWQQVLVREATVTIWAEMP